MANRILNVRNGSCGRSGWWLTIDRWNSAANFENFTQVFGDRYRALDAELEGIAGEEVFIGTFEA